MRIFLDKETALWSKIEAFDFPKEFPDRLGKDYGWTDTFFTARAIREYEKFMFLTVSCHFPVTPSEIVDKVWHTHLLYTRSYIDLCISCLGQTVHHDPGGANESFKDQYEATLNAYIGYFGEPPLDIWPKPKRSLWDRITGPFKYKEEKREDSYSLSSVPDNAFYSSCAASGVFVGSNDTAVVESSFGGGSFGGSGAGADYGGSDSSGGDSSSHSSCSSSSDGGSSCSGSSCGSSCGGGGGD